MSDINKDKLLELAESLGYGKSKGNGSDKFKNMADKYKDKSEDEILEELRKLKKSLFTDEKKFNQQMKALNGIKNMLNNEQKSKLENILDILSKEK